MGMHYSIVAVPCTREQLIEAYKKFWPSFIPKTQQDVSGFDELATWSRQNARRVPYTEASIENCCINVYGFIQDGRWAILLDAEHLIPSDEENLIKLSVEFGTCLVFSNETMAGCASFYAYKDGQLVRKVSNFDGNVSMSGSALTEERGIRMKRYYMLESQKLQERFQIHCMHSAPPELITAIAFFDKTDYAKLRAEREQAYANRMQMRADEAQSEGSQTRKAWWKFW